MALFGSSYSKFKGSDAAVISLNHSTVEKQWADTNIIRNTSVMTRETTFTKMADDYAFFTVEINIFKNTVPADVMNTILPYNHDTVNFMPHQDSGVYVQKVGGGDASFYIQSMTPVYVNNSPPILEDMLIIKFVALEPIDTSGSIP